MQRKIINKWQNYFYLSFLFYGSFFSTSVYAIQQNSTPIWESYIRLLSCLFGFIGTALFYAKKRSKKEFNSERRKISDILINDFWFEEFIFPRLTTFIYYISLSTFFSCIIFSLFMLLNTFSIIYLWYILIAPLQLIIIRLIFESAISIIKIAKNITAHNEQKK